MADTARSDRSKATAALESSEHGFDVQGFSKRVTAELTAQGVSLERNEGIYLARLFAQRAKERRGTDAVIENMFAHPLWVHVAAAHDEVRQSHVIGCKTCALLRALWLIYVSERDEREKHAAATAKASRAAVTKLNGLEPLLAANPYAVDDLEMLRTLKERLGDYVLRRAPKSHPAPPNRARRGRRPLTLLREIERVLDAAGFQDWEIAKLVCGRATKSRLQGVRDRRRTGHRPVNRLEK